MPTDSTAGFRWTVGGAEATFHYDSGDTFTVSYPMHIPTAWAYHGAAIPSGPERAVELVIARRVLSDPDLAERVLYIDVDVDELAIVYAKPSAVIERLEQRIEITSLPGIWLTRRLEGDRQVTLIQVLDRDEVAAAISLRSWGDCYVDWD